MLEIVNITKFCEFQLKLKSLFVHYCTQWTAKCELKFHFAIKISLRLGIPVFFFLFDEKKNKKNKSKFFEESLLCVYIVHCRYCTQCQKWNNSNGKNDEPAQCDEMRWWRSNKTNGHTNNPGASQQKLNGWKMTMRQPNTKHWTLNSSTFLKYKWLMKISQIVVECHLVREKQRFTFHLLFNFIFRLLLHQRLLLLRLLWGMLYVVYFILFLLLDRLFHHFRFNDSFYH